MNLMNTILSTDFFYSVFRITTPILFAAMAALISSKAGIPNLGLEGSMLFAALCGVFGSAFSHRVWVGVLCAVLGGVLLNLIIAYFSLHLQADPVIAGVAINLFASGGTVFLLYVISGDRGISSSLASLAVPTIAVPIINSIPVIGKIFSNHNILTYTSFLTVLMISILLKKTKLGLRIRSVGDNSEAARSVGIKVNVVRYKALLIAGVLCGLGGAYMSMGYLTWFTKDMVAGRGFIALAAEAMGGGSPLVTMLSALLFGLSDTLANSLQTLKISVELVQMIPYIVTIVALSVYSYRNMKQKE